MWNPAHLGIENTLRSKVRYSSGIFVAQNAENERARLALRNNDFGKSRMFAYALVVMVSVYIVCVFVVVVVVRMSICSRPIGIVQNAKKR